MKSCKKFNFLFFILFCIFTEYIFAVPNRNDGIIINRGEFYVQQELENNGIIHNHNKIMGAQNISGLGTIINYNELKTSNKDYSIYRVAGNESVDDYIQNDMSHAAYYELLNQNNSITNFYYSNISYFQQDISTTNTVITDSNGLDEVFFSPEHINSAIIHNSESTVPIIANNNAHIYPSFLSLEGYSDNDYNAPPINLNVKLEKLGQGEVVFHGNNSWFNDVFELKEGSAKFLDTSKIFGGEVNLYPNTKITWQGGEKDEYNTPVLSLNDAKLVFELPTGQNSIFSNYAKISGNENSLIKFSSGTVFIKNDCSNFRGIVEVQTGAKFVIKKSDRESSRQYEGQMFGGELSILDASGNLGGEISIKSNSGLTPLKINNGTVNIEDDDEEESSETQQIKSLSIGKKAKVVLKQLRANFSEGTTIEGELEIASGDNTEFHNLDLHGGTLKITSNNIKKLLFNGDVKVGSTIDLINENNCIQIDASQSIINFAYNSDLHLKCSVDPQNKEVQSGRLDFQNIRNPNNNKIIVDMINFLSPMTEDIFEFQIISLQDDSASYPNIISSDNITLIAKNNIYIEDLYTEKSLKPGFFKILRRYINGLTLKENKAFNEAYKPLRSAHVAGLLSINNISNTIMSETNTNDSIYFNIFHDDSKYSVCQNKVTIEDNTSILMLGTGAFSISNGYKMNLSVFGALSDKDIETTKCPGNGKNVMAGIKASVFKNQYNFNFIMAFNDLHTEIFSKEYNKTKLKSRIADFGCNFNYRSQISAEKFITYSLFLNYQNAQSLTSKIGDLQIENACSQLLFINSQIAFSHFEKNNIFSSGVNLNKKCGTLKNIVRYSNKRSGYEKAYNVEIFVNLKTKITPYLDFEASMSDFVGNKKGKKVSLSLNYTAPPSPATIIQFVKSIFNKIIKLPEKIGL